MIRVRGFDGPVGKTLPVQSPATKNTKPAVVNAPKPASVTGSQAVKVSFQNRPTSTTPPPIADRPVAYSPASVRAQVSTSNKSTINSSTASGTRLDVMVGRQTVPVVSISKTKTDGYTLHSTPTGGRFDGPAGSYKKAAPASPPEPAQPKTSVQAARASASPASSVPGRGPSTVGTQTQGTATLACKTTSIRTNGLAESAQFTSTTVRTTKASQEPAPTDAVALKFTPTRLAGPTEARNTVTASPSPKQPPAGLTLDELNTYKECEALEKQNLPLIPQCGFISEERWGAGPEEERLAQLVARSTVNGKVSQDLLYQNLREERQRTAKETAMAYVPDPSDVTGVSQAITGMAGAAGGALFRAAGTRATQSSPGTSKPTAVQTATTADTRSVTRGQELREKYSQLSAEQRNHIIQDSKATDFGRIADSIDVRSDGHSRKRHGIVTTEQQQVTRATTGLTPDGVQGRKVDSSRFVSDEMLVKAVQKAEARRSPNIMETPDHRLTIDVDMGETAGEVWKKGTGEYLGTTSVVRVRFDDETGHPYTAYPIMKDRREQ